MFIKFAPFCITIRLQLTHPAKGGADSILRAYNQNRTVFKLTDSQMYWTVGPLKSFSQIKLRLVSSLAIYSG